MKKLVPLLLILGCLIGISPAQAESSFLYQTNTVNSGQAFKVPVQVATTAAINLTGSQTIDGLAVSDHTTDGSGKSPDRVLVKNQSDQTTNGIYTVNSGGAWARAPDFQGVNNVVTGTQVTVNGGTQAGFWNVTTTNPVVIGNSGITVYAPSIITFVATQIPVPQNLALASANLLVGNSLGNAASVSLSGDCALSNTGAITCTKSNGVNLSSAATAVETDNLCMVGSGGIWQAGSCTGPSGSGTVNIGTATQLGYYATSSNVISSNSFLTVGSTGILSATGFSGPLTGNVTGNTTGIHSGSLANGVTATTQSAGDNSTKVATDAFTHGGLLNTVTVITSSLTWTPATGTNSEIIFCWGGGGGGEGGGSSPGNGGNGTTTSVGSLCSATGGTGGIAATTGIPGVGSLGLLNLGGSAATASLSTSTTNVLQGMSGAPGFLGAGAGAGGVSSTGGNAAANSGAGGGGGSSGTASGPGGAGGNAGGQAVAFASATSSQIVTIGSGGLGGTLGSSGTAGGNGAKGGVLILEFK